MDNNIGYLNTDLDLVCSDDLTELANAFDVGGAFPLHVTQEDDGMWYARFETNKPILRRSRTSPRCSRSSNHLLSRFEAFGCAVRCGSSTLVMIAGPNLGHLIKAFRRIYSGASRPS